MNNSLYEEYMRSILGYEPEYRDTYNMNYDNILNDELEACYPDTYRIVYPMVQTACMQNTRPLTRETIDAMTNEIYFALEDNNLGEERGEEKTEDRQIIRNQGLNDLIRILLLRELLGRPGFPIRPRPPMRPPRPPMRPPMGPGPGRPPRPGMRYSDYDLYEY